MLVASRKYLDRRGRPASPADLSKHLRIGTGDEDVWELRKGSEGHTVGVSPAFSSNSALLGLEVAASGAGIAWVPCHIAMSRTVGEHGLERVLPDWELSTIMLYALFDSRVVSTRAQVFLDVLVRHLTGAESHA